MANVILTSAIESLCSGHNLESAEASLVLGEIMGGEVSDVQIAGFLIALRTKGETVDELVGLATTMRALAVPVKCEREDLLDTAGTGGGYTTYNVSTTAALIAAGAGCAVAKHGNRSSTGSSGSADVLEALGAQITNTPEQVAACIDQTGFGFMFAPLYHRAMRFVISPRRELAVQTIFNLLGPLTNPALASRQLIGVSNSSFLELLAGAAQKLGTKRTLVLSSEDGLDEISLVAPTEVVEVNYDETVRYNFCPEDVGLQTVSEAQFRECGGGSAKENAAMTRSILYNIAPKPPTELALINAGAAIYTAGGEESIGAGVESARLALEDGSAAEALERYLVVSNS